MVIEGCSIETMGVESLKPRTCLLLSLLLLTITILIGITTGDAYHLPKVPAVVPMGFGFAGFCFFYGLYRLAFPICEICHGLGATDLNIWGKIINAFDAGHSGKKCSHCNGAGEINLNKFYMKNKKGGIEK